MAWKIVLVLGILGMLLGGAVVGITGLLVITSDGRISLEEGMLGIIPGALVLIISLFIAVLGLIFVIKNRKKA